MELMARAPDAEGFCCAKVHSSRRGTVKPHAQAKTTQPKVGCKSVFDVLASESDEEPQTEDFPAIGRAPTQARPVTTGWATVAAAAAKPKSVPVKPKPAPVKPAPVKVEQQDNSAWSDGEEEATKQAFWEKMEAESKKFAGKSWADSDWEDSDDEDGW